MMGDMFDKVQFSDRDYTDIVMKNPNALWLQRAVNNPARTEKNQSVFTMTGIVSIDGKDRHVVLPRVRLDEKTGLLHELTKEEAWNEAMRNKDFILADSAAEAEFISRWENGEELF